MKILVLNYEFPPLGGGAAPVSKELALNMAKRGHQIDVVTMKYKGLPEYEEIEGVHIYRVNCLRTKMSSCQPWEQLTYILSAKSTIKKLLSKNTYDLCHTHFIVPTGVLSRWIKRKYGLQYIITSHGSDVEGYNTKKGNLIVHKLIRGSWKSITGDATTVVAPSEYLASLMRKSLQREYKIIPNGIDLRLYQNVDKGLKDKRIIFVGRLQSTKNVQSIIKAAALVNLGGWKIDIVGDGPYRVELEKLVHECHLDDVIVFHGWLPNASEKLVTLLKRASLFISMSYFESFGVAVVEAIASGCSVLLSDIEAHKMFVNNTECLVNPDDVEGLAKKIDMFINGKNTLSVNRSIIEKYSWDVVTNIYEEEYKKILYTLRL